MAYTADDLVTAVRRRAKRPSATADGKVSDADILALADEEMQTVVVPAVARANEEYYVIAEDLTLNADAQVQIPSRAVAGAVRDIVWLSTEGNEFSLPEIPLEDVGIYKNTSSAYWRQRLAYSVEGDMIQVLPTDSPAGTLRVKYMWRPGRLVLTSDTDNVALINSITSGSASTQFSTTAYPASWTAGGGITFDCVQSKPNFDLLFQNVEAKASDSGVSISVSTAVADDTRYGRIVANDWLCTNGTSPIVQAPVELHPMLFTSTVRRVLFLVGDYEAASHEERTLGQQLSALETLYDPRNKGESKKILNRYSALRAGGKYRGGY